MICPMICPRCDGELDRCVAIEWGKGGPLTPIVPFICSLCASLLLLEVETEQLRDPEAIGRRQGFDLVGLIRANEVLWAEIEDARKRILAVPGRRPVLR